MTDEEFIFSHTNIGSSGHHFVPTATSLHCRMDYYFVQISQRMSPTDFYDPPSFPPAPAQLTFKVLSENYLMDCH